jgi:hypothetical protein
MKTSIIRRKYLVNPKFQLKVIFLCSVLVMLVLTAFAVSNWYFFQQLTDLAKSSGLPPKHIFYEFIDGQKNIMLKLYIWASFFSLIIIYFAGIYFSNKVSGPLYRMTEHLKKSSLSKVEPLSFRKGDFFQELKDAFNDFIQRKD